MKSVAASVSEWTPFRSPVRQAQGPEPFRQAQGRERERGTNLRSLTLAATFAFSAIVQIKPLEYPDVSGDATPSARIRGTGRPGKSRHGISPPLTQEILDPLLRFHHPGCRRAGIQFEHQEVMRLPELADHLEINAPAAERVGGHARLR